MLKKQGLLDQFIKEVKIQMSLNHQNIVSIYGVFSEGEHVYLILEYFRDGTLYTKLKKDQQKNKNSTYQLEREE